MYNTYVNTHISRYWHVFIVLTCYITYILTYNTSMCMHTHIQQICQSYSFFSFKTQKIQMLIVFMLSHTLCDSGIFDGCCCFSSSLFSLCWWGWEVLVIWPQICWFSSLSSPLYCWSHPGSTVLLFLVIVFFTFKISIWFFPTPRTFYLFTRSSYFSFVSEEFVIAFLKPFYDDCF